MQPVQLPRRVTVVALVTLVSLVWLNPSPSHAAALQPKPVDLLLLFPPPKKICEGRTARFVLQVTDKQGIPLPDYKVLVSSPDGEKEGKTNLAGIVEFKFEFKSRGEKNLLFYATPAAPPAGAQVFFTLTVVRCKLKVNLNYRGTYQGSEGTATALWSVFSLVDDGEMRLAADATFIGKAKVSFDQEAVIEGDGCRVTLTGSGEGDLTMKGISQEDSIAVSLAFQSFPVSAALSGACPEGAGSVPVPSDEEDLSFMGISDFTVAAEGGSVNRAVRSYGPFSGRGAVTVNVYPEEEREGSARFFGGSIAHERID